MNILIKDKLSEKLASVSMDDSVQKAIVNAINIGATKIAVYDQMKNYWIVSLWRLSQFDPKISLKQAYDERKTIFEKVDTVSSDEEIAEIIPKLYRFPGLIVTEGENIKGFISLADFSDSELKQKELLKKTPEYKSMMVAQIKQKSQREEVVGLDLSGADLSNADLSKSELKGINLSGADLSKAILWEANLTGADLSNANLSEAKLDRAILNGAKLIKAKLNKASLKIAQLWYADLEEAQLEGADLTEAVLYSANLRSANLRNATLYKAGLISAKLDGADLSNANIRSVTFKNAYFDEKTKWNDVEIDSITIDHITDERIKRLLTSTPPTPVPTTPTAATTPLEIKIISPKNGDKVPITAIINGTISGEISNDRHIWLVVNPHTSPGKWWPQSGRIIPWNGKWNTQAQFGGENETGQEFDIAVILVDKQTDQYYQDYLKTGEQTRSFPGLPFPNNATISDRITVTRI